MIIHTASEGVTLAKQLENESAQFYEELASKYTKDAETLLSFSGENKKNTAQIDRVYYGVITDAIEGGYAFNLEADNYVLNTDVMENAGYSDMLKQAVEIEDKITAFYNEAASQSDKLMADVPRAFRLLAKKRESRLEKLKQLL